MLKVSSKTCIQNYSILTNHNSYATWHKAGVFSKKKKPDTSTNQSYMGSTTFSLQKALPFHFTIRYVLSHTSVV